MANPKTCPSQRGFISLAERKNRWRRWFHVSGGAPSSIHLTSPCAAFPSLTRRRLPLSNLPSTFLHRLAQTRLHLLFYVSPFVRLIISSLFLPPRSLSVFFHDPIQSTANIGFDFSAAAGLGAVRQAPCYDMQKMGKERRKKKKKNTERVRHELYADRNREL